MATFPLLKTVELVKFFKDEKNLEMTIDQFTNPSPDSWYNIYLILAAKILNLLPEELEDKLRLRALTTEHFFLYEGTITNIKLTRLLKAILASIGVRDYSLTDIKKPNKKRLCFTLSGILNFLRFQDSLVYMYDDIIAKEREEKAQNASLTALKKDKEKEKEELKQEELDLKRSIENFGEKSREIEAALKTSYERVQDLKKKKDEATAKLQELCATAARKKEQLEALKDRLRSAQSAIVHSPMRQKQDIQLNKEKMPRLCDTHNHYLAKRMNTKMQLDELRKAKEEGTYLLATFKNLMSDADDIKEKERLLYRRKDEMEDISIEMESEKRNFSELTSDLKSMNREAAASDDLQRKEISCKQVQLSYHVDEHEKNKKLITKKIQQISMSKQLEEEFNSQMALMEDAFKKKENWIKKSSDELKKHVEKFMDKTYEDFQNL